ncbi:MAG: glycosyltransferase family 4 protein [Patescibacteria group bacterium]|jgi:glycosyltransferase involved in cell wall biosynthesis
MNVLNIGTDKTLVGGEKLGDAIQRHRRYGEFLDHLDIVVYTNKKEGLNKFEISQNVIGYPTNSISKLFFIPDVLKIFKKINQDHKVDIIVCQDPFLPAVAGCLLKKKYKVKLQINFHGDFWQNPSWLKERWLNIFFLLISKFTVPKADLIRVMSHGQKEKLGKYKEKARVISTPIDIEKYNTEIDPESIHEFLISNQLNNKKIILGVGRQDRVKNYPLLFKAVKLVFNDCKDIVLALIGGGGFTRESNDLTYNQLPYELKTYFAPIADSKFVDLFYRIAYVVVSSSNSESFGKVLVEANAHGKPVVSTATTGAKEIIQDGYNGFLVPIGDAQALADKIVYLLNNPDKAKEMGENGRRLVKEKYGDNTQKIISAWQELMGNKNNAY